MYNTSKDYKNKVYLPSTKHLLKVFINDEEIPSKSILGFDSSQSTLPEKVFTYGSIPSQNITLKLETKVVPENIDKVYIVSGIKGEEVPIGYFKVSEIGEKNSATTTLKLEDYMLKFEVNYDGSGLIKEKTEPTLLEVLQDICTQVGVELGSTSFLNCDSKTAQYDNTISARTYLSYIAEQACGFAVIGRDGKLYIKQYEVLDGEEIASGTEINITPSETNPYASFQFEGRSTQETRSGKNIFDNTKKSGYGSSVDETALETGMRITCTYNTTGSTRFRVWAVKDLTNYVGKTIRVKTNIIPSSTNQGRIMVGLCSSAAGNRVSKAQTDISGKEISFVIPELTAGQEYLAVWLYGTLSNATAGDYVDYTDLIITIDNEDMTYEPYGASPSPEFPSEIKSVTDINEVIKSKNFYNKDDVINGKWLNKTNAQSNNSLANISDFIDISHLITPTFICKNTKSSTNYYTVNQYDSNKTWLTGNEISVTSNQTRRVTVGINEKCKYIKISLYDYNNIVDFMLYDGLDDTYAAFQETNITIPLQQPFRSIGETKDTFEKIDGKWYEVHNIKERIINGSENWNITNNTFRATILTNSKLNDRSHILVISNYFNSLTYNDNWDVSKNWVSKHASSNALVVSFPTYSTLSDFKTWLSNNNVKINYILQEPELIECTEQQSLVLNTLQNIKLYNGINYIYSMNEIAPETKIKEKYELDKELLGEYKWGEEFRVTRIRYDDGIQLYEKGNETGNTVYISQENMYINNQKQIDNIYAQAKDLDVFSFTGKTIVDPALDVGDIFVLDGRQVIYQGSKTYGGRFLANISSEIQSKQQEETTARVVSEKVARRRIQSRVDEVEGAIELLATEVEDNYATQAELSVKTSEIKAEAKSETTATIMTLLNNGYLTADQVNTLVDGNTQDITNIKKQLEATITDTQMQIAIQTAIEGGVSYLKNTLFTIDENGMAIATDQDEFNALYNNRGMYLYSYHDMIARFDVDGATLRNLKVNGEIETNNLRIMDVNVDGVPHAFIHWIGG